MDVLEANWLHRAVQVVEELLCIKYASVPAALVEGLHHWFFVTAFGWCAVANYSEYGDTGRAVQ